MIRAPEFHARMKQLRQRVAAPELDAFLVSSEESIYPLTGVSCRPLERPLFIFQNRIRCNRKAGNLLFLVRVDPRPGKSPPPDCI